MRRDVRWWFPLVLSGVNFAVSIAWTLVRHGTIDWQRAIEGSVGGFLAGVVILLVQWAVPLRSAAPRASD